MRAKELLEKISLTEYSQSTKIEIFLSAKQDLNRADEVARLMDEAKTEEELLEMLKQLPHIDRPTEETEEDD